MHSILVVLIWKFVCLKIYSNKLMLSILQSSQNSSPKNFHSFSFKVNRKTNPKLLSLNVKNFFMCNHTETYLKYTISANGSMNSLHQQWALKKEKASAFFPGNEEAFFIYTRFFCLPICSISQSKKLQQKRRLQKQSSFLLNIKVRI